MDRFFMFGKYSSMGHQQASAERTVLVRELVTRMGGKVRDIYALLGKYDLVVVVELPSMTDAMKTAVALGQLTGVSFSTCAAVPIAEFDKMAEDLATEIESARMEGCE